MKIDLKLYFKVMSILMLIYGILLCCTIVGLIIGIPLIIGRKAMSNAETMTEDQLKEQNSTLLVWGIVFGAITLPAGVAAIIFAVVAYNQIAGTPLFENESKENKKGFDNEEIKRKLDDCQRMRDNGIISDEEYEQMRRKILGL